MQKRGQASPRLFVKECRSSLKILQIRAAPGHARLVNERAWPGARESSRSRQYKFTALV